jgi:hypothetical protein
VPKQPSDSGRVILNEEAKAALTEMLASLRAREEHVRISPSVLASEAIVRYAKRAFALEQDEIARRHFNPREYLKKVMNQLPHDADPAQVLESALKRMRSENRGPPRPRRRRKADLPAPDDASTASS